MNDSYYNNLIDKAPKGYSETLLNIFPSAVFSVNSEGKITSWNKRAENILGYTSDEILGKDCTTFELDLFNTDLELYSKGIEKLVADRICAVKNKQGDILTISKNVEIQKDLKGNVIGRIECFENFTEKIINEALLKESSLSDKSLIETVPDLIYMVDKDGIFIDYITGDNEDLFMPKEMLLGKNIFKIFPQELAEQTKQCVDEVLHKKPVKAIEYQISVKSGIGFYECKIYAFDETKVIAIVRSITEHKCEDAYSNDESDNESKSTKENESTKESESTNDSERKYQRLIAQIQQGIATHEAILDKDGNVIDYRFLEVNENFERLTGLKREKIIGKTILEIQPETEMYWIERYGHVAMTGEQLKYDNYLEEQDKYFETVAYSPQHKQFTVIISDITERKKVEKENFYLNFHDQLTGLYNRRYHQEELKRLDTKRNLPISIAMVDVNGLKLINDSFGHKTGDELLKKVAEIITKACRAYDIIARLGGDEFIVILPKTNINKAKQIIKRINELTLNEKIRTVNISISFGYYTKNNEEESIEEVFKRAENNMYRHKLSESSSMRSKTIDIILNTLYEKNNREMLHSKRVSEICNKLGIEMGLEDDAVNELKTAGLMHDIGKIGIDENILNKPRRLNYDEMSEIERHSEKGYRILSSVNEFSEIAGYVLEHHEKWNGKGYPRGLKGEEISLQARIISIADAFDAISSERSYSKAASEDEAKNVIRQFSGIQFDPKIARVFIEKVLGKEWDEFIETKQ